MLTVKSMSLPVILVFAILAACIFCVQAGNVRVYNQHDSEITIGDFDPEDTKVGQLKEKVAIQTGTELDRLRLVTANGTPLRDDELLLSEYLLINEQDLLVKIHEDLTEPGLVHVDIGQERLSLVVTKNQTVAMLKRESLGEAEPRLYRVFFDGSELLDESMTLGDLRLFDDAHVVIFKFDQTFKVKVHPLAEEPVDFDVTLETRVQDLRYLMEKAKLDINNRLLIHSNKILSDDRKLFTYSRMFHQGLAIQIIERLAEPGGNILFHYKKPGKEALKYLIYITPANTVDDLKKFIGTVLGIVQYEKLSLKFQGEILREDRELHLFVGARIDVLGPE